MALWSLARKHQPSNQRNDGLESNLRAAVGRDAPGEAMQRWARDDSQLDPEPPGSSASLGASLGGLGER